jgi:preprotein translocase subunit SecE
MDSTELTSKLKQWPLSIKDYFGELQMEMRRVTWPSRKQVEGTTVVVIATVFGFAAYFFVIDFLFGHGITKVFNAFTR